VEKRKPTNKFWRGLCEKGSKSQVGRASKSEFSPLYVGEKEALKNGGESDNYQYKKGKEAGCERDKVLPYASSK